MHKPQEEDTGSSQTLAWSIPILECGITTTEVAASGTQGQAGYTPAQLHHVIYLNPAATSVHVMYQVKLTCKYDVVKDERTVLKKVSTRLIFLYIFKNRESSSEVEITNSTLVDDVEAILDLPNMVEYVQKQFETYF